MNEPILVTGATGFIGGRVARRLLDQGRALRLLIRDPRRLEAPLRRAALIAGDVRDPEAVARAVRGARTVIHLAACARAWSRDPDEFRATNVEAVRHLLAASLRENVERFVHVSTVLATPPFAAAVVPADARRLTPYEESKMAAERVVAEFAERGLNAVVVRPTRVFGAGPLHTDANAVTRVVALYLAGRFRARLDDGDALANWVHVQDVAAGIVLAAGRGHHGADYMLGGENASFRRFLELVGEIGGVTRRVLALPPRVGLAMGRACDLWARLGLRAPLSSGWIRVFLEDRRADIEPARRDLGYAPRSLRAGLTETIAWLRERASRAA